MPQILTNDNSLVVAYGWHQGGEEYGMASLSGRALIISVRQTIKPLADTPVAECGLGLMAFSRSAILRGYVLWSK
jgi:hypothetical protein